MIDYRTPRLSDRTWAEPLLFASGNWGCENNFTNIFVWQKTYGQSIARWKDFVLLRYTQPKAVYHLFPSGLGEPQQAVRALVQDAAERGERLELIGLTAQQMDELEQWYPGKFDLTMSTKLSAWPRCRGRSCRQSEITSTGLSSSTRSGRRWS